LWRAIYGKLDNCKHQIEESASVSSQIFHKRQIGKRHSDAQAYVQASNPRYVLLPRFNVGRLAYGAILVNNFMFPNIKKDEISRQLRVLNL
jgi:hypothetical protein